MKRCDVALAGEECEAAHVYRVQNEILRERNERLEKLAEKLERERVRWKEACSQANVRAEQLEVAGKYEDRFRFLARIFLESGSYIEDDLAWFFRIVQGPVCRCADAVDCERLKRIAELERERDEARREAEQLLHEVSSGDIRFRDRDRPLPWSKP